MLQWYGVLVSGSINEHGVKKIILAVSDIMTFLLRVAVVWMILLYILNSVSARAANSANWHAVVLKPLLLSQQVDCDEFEESVNVTVPSTNAGI